MGGVEDVVLQEMQKKEKGNKQPNANEIKLQPLQLTAAIVEKKAKIDRYKDAIDDLATKIQMVSQANPAVIGEENINEDQGQNPFELLGEAFTAYAVCHADPTATTRLTTLASQCEKAAKHQRTIRDEVRKAIKHLRRYSLVEYKELHDNYVQMEELLKLMDNARNEVRDCTNAMEIDKKALNFKVFIAQFETQTAKVQALLNNFDAHVVIHAKNVVDFMGVIRKYYEEPKLSKAK